MGKTKKIIYSKMIKLLKFYHFAVLTNYLCLTFHVKYFC
jgi:hypothetical protein